MELETYLAFVVASIVLCVVPGPDMIFLLGRSIANGRKAGLYAAFGVNAGAYVHLVAASLGLTALLLASATAFMVVKWLGAIYLLYLGFTIFFSKTNAINIDGTTRPKDSHSKIFWQGFLSDVLNPKVALFYVSIFPQFVDIHAGNSFTQFMILGLSLNMIGLISNIFYVYFAATMTKKLRESVRISYWLNRALGSLLVGLGIRVASEHQ